MVELSEKYRPNELDGVIGQEPIVEAIKNRDYPKNFLFIGPAGCGKTTLAHLLAKRYNLPIEEFNASDDRGIGVVRGEIKRMTRTRGKKIILLDEADRLTKEAQDALRRIMENPKSDAYFILTGNDGWRISEAIKSRCTDFDFKKIDDKQVLLRLIDICKKEGITIEEESKEGLVQLVHQVNGDMRKAINTLEKVVDKDKRITKKTVISFIRPNTASSALKKALEGDWEKSKDLMEDAFFENLNSPKQVLQELYDAVDEVERKEWKILLYRELAKVERSVKTTADPILPLIQFVGFLSYAWLLPHYPDSTKELT